MRPQPLISVADVEQSSRWYQHVLGARSDHGGKEYERLVVDGVLIMQLHRWEVAHDHGPTVRRSIMSLRSCPAIELGPPSGSSRQPSRADA